MFFEIKKIKIINFEMKPNKGGIPAKDNNKITKKVVIKGILPKNFKSFNVFIYFKSKIKNIKNIFINIKI